MIKLSKKAQIGIFIILATILVIAGISVFIYNSENISLFQDEKSSYKIKTFVESCLDAQTKKAINEIGLHGGWLYHNELKFADKNTNRYLISKMRGMNNFGVELPYWFYYDSNSGDKGEFKLNIPSYDDKSDKYSLVNQVKLYLDENLEKNCIKNFKDFENSYNIVYEPKKINTNVEFDENNIFVSLDLPLEINEINTNNTEYIEKFTVKKKNKLFIPYNIAKDIVLTESKNSFLERAFINIITPYQNSNRRDLLPPFYDFKFNKYDMNFWDVRKVEKMYKRIISANVHLIQFMNSDYSEPRLPENLKNDEFVNAVYGIYKKDYLSDNSANIKDKPEIFNEYKNYKIKLKYEPFYPTFFSLAPSYGDIILMPRPEMITNFIPMFFTEYTSVYEVTMPLLFEIKESSKYSYNDKFVFNLLLETNIDYNAPLANKKDFGFDLSKIKNLNSEKTLICDPSQFVSGYYSLNISDPLVGGTRYFDSQIGEYNKPISGIEDAIVTFDCKGINTCYLGKSELNGEYTNLNVSRLKFRLPIDCYPGTLKISKFGYKTLKFENLDPKEGVDVSLIRDQKHVKTNGEYYWNMESLKTFKLNVKLVNDFLGNPSSLKSGLNLTGFLIFENKANEDLIQVVKFNETNQYNLTVKLVSGNYSVTGFVITEKPFIIPSQRIHGETIPQINMSSWIYGSLELDNFEITLDDLLYSKEITTNLIQFGVPSSFDDLNALSEKFKNIKSYSEHLKPRFN